MREEIQKASKLGEACKLTENYELLSTDLTIAIIIKAILSRKGKNFIIDGFPRSLEQASYFDQNVQEIKHIINLNAKEEVMFSRTKGNKLKIRKFMEQKAEVIDYYNKFGVVKHVDANPSDSNLIYSYLKKEFLPEIYLIIGKRYSGKSTISNFLKERMSMEIIYFNDFINDPEISKRKNDDEFVINSFLRLQRDRQITRFIINDFPASKDFYNLFVKNGRNIRKVFYLNVSNNTCTTRTRDLCKKEKKFIGCSQLNTELYEFDKKIDIIDFYKKKTDFVEINANNDLQLVKRDIIRCIQPTVFIFSSDSEAVNLKAELVNYFVNNNGYEVLNVSTLINDTIQRGNEIGQKLRPYSENMKKIPNNLIIDLIKSIIFKETNDKFILVNYPRNSEDVNLLYII